MHGELSSGKVEYVGPESWQWSGCGSKASPPSQLSTVAPEDLGLLEEELASPKPLNPEEVSEKDACSHLQSDASDLEQGTPKRWKQLEQW